MEKQGGETLLNIDQKYGFDITSGHHGQNQKNTIFTLTGITDQIKLIP